jgi:hypothetical protein
MTLAEGQDIGFILLTMAGAATLVRRRRPVAAGVIASLCLAKFHLFLLIPVWICARRQWRFARGLAAGCAALIALSFIAGGWSWPLQYLALLREPSSNPYTEVMPNLHAAFAAAPHAGIIEFGAFIVPGFAVWVASRRGRGEAGLAAALAAGILVAPHAYMADGAILIPAFLLMMKKTERMFTRSLWLYLLTPIPWIFLMTGLAMPARLALLGLLALLAFPAVRSTSVRDRGNFQPSPVS